MEKTLWWRRPIWSQDPCLVVQKEHSLIALQPAQVVLAGVPMQQPASQRTEASACLHARMSARPAGCLAAVQVGLEYERLRQRSAARRAADAAERAALLEAARKEREALAADNMQQVRGRVPL
eukprot:364837-Chlamydomonas_euryale.AAC.9